MNKVKYLDSLREELSFELPGRLVEKNIRFYEEYFKEQAETGKSEEEIAEELGDPRLIARSCIDAAKSGVDGIPDSEDDVDFSKEMAEESAKGSRKQSGMGSQTKKVPFGVHVLERKGCIVAAIVFILLCAILIAFFSTDFGKAILIVLLIASGISAIYRYLKR